MNDKQRLLAGKLHNPYRVNMQWPQIRQAVKDFNASDFWMDTAPLERLKTRFGAVGENVTLTPPFYCDHGDKIYIGHDFYANTGLTILDANRVTIGDRVLLGPHVSIYTAAHPIDAHVRHTNLEYALPVHIGSDVWIGGNVVINPGVSIGSNVVIGSGSVVTKDIPDGVVAAGNPCRVLRQITQSDQDFWNEQLADYQNDHD